MMKTMTPLRFATPCLLLVFGLCAPSPGAPDRADHEPIIEEATDGGTEQTRFREFNKEYVDKLVISSTVPHALREQYRRLGASLHHAQEEGGLKTLMGKFGGDK